MGRLKTPLRTLHQPAFTCAPANATPVLRDDRTPVPVFSWKAEGDVSLGFGGLGFPQKNLKPQEASLCETTRYFHHIFLK